MKKVHDALQYLKSDVKSVHYEDIDIENTVHLLLDETHIDSDNTETPDSHQPDSQHQDQSDADNERTDVTDETETPEDQSAGPVLDTFLMPVDMIQEALPFCPDSILSIAPCEGNRPTNMFRDKRCEALSFPNHFPDGRNTLTEERPVKLLPSKYFQARLMNVDTRFASDPQYIFFTHYITVEFHFKQYINSTEEGKKEYQRW